MNFVKYREDTKRQFSNYHRNEYLNIAIILGVGLLTGAGLTAYLMW